MAFSAVWMAVASLLATFDIEKALDKDGNVIEPSPEYLSGILMCAIFSLLCAFFTSPRYQNAKTLQMFNQTSLKGS
jgi:hypothetical protein